MRLFIRLLMYSCLSVPWCVSVCVCDRYRAIRVTDFYAQVLNMPHIAAFSSSDSLGNQRFCALVS